MNHNHTIQYKHRLPKTPSEVLILLLVRHVLAGFTCPHHVERVVRERHLQRVHHAEGGPILESLLQSQYCSSRSLCVLRYLKIQIHSIVFIYPTWSWDRVMPVTWTSRPCSANFDAIYLSPQKILQLITPQYTYCIYSAYIPRCTTYSTAHVEYAGSVLQ